MTSGCDHGSWFPPVLRPRSSRTREATRAIAPRKSMRLRGCFVLGIDGNVDEEPDHDGGEDDERNLEEESPTPGDVVCKATTHDAT